MYFLTKRKKGSTKERKKPINYLILGKTWLSYRYFCQF